MHLEKVSNAFVERLSIWKTLGMEAILAALAVLPLMPNFSNGLVHTAFFYRMPSFILLVGACVFLGLLALIFLLFLWRAIAGVPVLTISEETVTALGWRPRSVSRSNVLRMAPTSPGNINLEIRGERPIALPIFLYRHPRLTRERLNEVVARGPDVPVRDAS